MLRFRYRPILIAVPFLYTGLSAAAVDSRLAGCRDLLDPAERLRCYDTVIDGDQEETSPAVPSSQDIPAQAPAAGPQQASAPAPEPSAMARRWQLVAQTERGPFVITPYRPNYVLPVSYNFRPNDTPYRQAGAVDGELDELEVKFQISFKTKVWPDFLSRDGDLWFAYTQQSFWQAYNRDSSAPFRETDFEPELIYSHKVGFNLLGLYGRILTLGFNHQSNGRSDPLSRSWNRIVGGVLFDNGDLAVQLRAWWRIPEDDSGDDNPNIEEYIGRGEVQGFYKFGEQTLAATVKNNFQFRDNRGSLQLDWSFPIGGALKGYVQYFYGYGDGLIDYDHISNRASLGLMLTDWL